MATTVLCIVTASAALPFSAGVQKANAAARLERNTFVGARTAAMLLNGAAAIVRNNHIRSGLGFGISAESLDHSVISDNEIDHNCAGGILVRNAQDTLVVSNRLYTNGYGIVMVLGAVRSPNTVADNLIVRHVEDGLYIVPGRTWRRFRSQTP